MILNKEHEELYRQKRIKEFENRDQCVYVFTERIYNIIRNDELSTMESWRCGETLSKLTSLREYIGEEFVIETWGDIGRILFVVKTWVWAINEKTKNEIENTIKYMELTEGD